MSKEQSTLVDVARQAGVSISTASRALAGQSVRKKNHASIMAAAKELGYVVNEAARSLRNVKSMTVGLVFFRLTGGMGIDLLSSFSTQLDAHGYCVLVATAQGDEAHFDRIIRTMFERRVDALVCVNAAGEGTDLHWFLNSGIPAYSLFTKSAGYNKLALVNPNVERAMAECARDMAAMGHRKAVVLHITDKAYILDAFISHANDAGIGIQKSIATSAEFSAENLLKICTEGRNPPSFILCGQSEASQLIATAELMNIRIPDDVSIVAIRDLSALMLQPRLPISFINIDTGLTGSLMASKLVRQLEGGPKIRPNTILHVGSWSPRSSTGPAPRRKTRA